MADIDPDRTGRFPLIDCHRRRFAIVSSEVLAVRLGPGTLVDDPLEFGRP
jgi:hypothetical protein